MIGFFFFFLPTLEYFSMQIARNYCLLHGWGTIAFTKSHNLQTPPVVL